MAASSTCVGVGVGGEEENIFEGDRILNHSISIEFWTMAGGGGGGGGSTHF